jgi:hypothetical protein
LKSSETFTKTRSCSNEAYLLASCPAGERPCGLRGVQGKVCSGGKRKFIGKDCQKWKIV